MRKHLFFTLLVLCNTCLLQAQTGDKYVTARDGRLYKDGAPYYYIGANYWYGAVLASAGDGGDRKRLARELDLLKKSGVDNLRILSGAEGPNGEPSRVTPALQLAPGKYDETLLDGLDYLMSELKKRNMHAILYLGNSWEWSGGYAQYLNWNGYGPIPYPILDQYEWSDFMKYVNEFHKSCEKCKEQYRDHIKFMLSRKNKYTGLSYTDDPAIMTWEIANEPRAFSNENLPAFEKWIHETAALIKSLDHHHLVTTGSEGQWGCEGSMDVFERIHADANVDYMTMHIWPKNWSWLDVKDIPGTVAMATQKTNEYIDAHVAVAKKIHKPLVLEEFGLPRDHHRYDLEDKTTARDAYYDNAFQHVYQSAKQHDVLVGCNFWAVGGTARPVASHTFWMKGDPLMGDPPQEEQGLNSVFDVDTTMSLVKKYTKLLTNTH